MKELVEKLNRIQANIKAPKGQRNAFGKYNYRSCEDITEALKPLLAKEGCVLIMTDEILLIGDRYYIKATLTFTDGNAEIKTSAMAREAENQSGMAPAQVTGSTSSYARKYALNGLLALDDTKDDDNKNNTKPEPVKKEPITPVDYAKAEAILRNSKTLAELKNNYQTIGKPAQEALVTVKDELKKILK